MAPLTKRRWSTRRQGKRRATHVFNQKGTSLCSNCHQVIIPHVVCPFCGFYKGKEVVKIVTKSKKEKPTS